MKKKLSIIITAHTEGLLAHKTMRSVFEGIKKLKKASIPYEIIVHIDNGDDKTIDYFSRHAQECKIFKNHFGDPGASRNFAASKATGDIITFTDADDLLSDNWLEEAYGIVSRSKDPVIVHPAACLTFGVDVQPVLNFYGESLSKEEDALVLLGENRWGVVVMAPREVFERFPYIKTENGYGHEDYYFSTETVCAGIKHLVAPGTVLFYRRGNQSVLDNNNSSGVVQPYSQLFDEAFPNIADLGENLSLESDRLTLFQFLQRTYHAHLKHLPGMRVIKKIAKPLIPEPSIKLTPAEQVVIKEWRKMNHIDTLLCPTPVNLKKLARFSEFQSIQCGIDYYNLVGSFREKPAYIFITPWMTIGGADKVIINYAKAMKELNAEARIMIITTLPNENKFKGMLPDNVDFVDFGNVSTNLSPFFKDRLFSRIITQSKCNKIHIINSEYGFEWVRRHLDFAKTLDLRASFFSFEYVSGFHGDCFFDYADMYLPLIAPAVKHIYTDNRANIGYLIQQCGINEKTCQCHYQPVDDIFTHPASTPHSRSKLHILWASRICHAKNPELLCKIAQTLSPVKYEIHVFGTIEEPYSPKIFSNIPTIHYHGPYQGVKTLDTSRYDAFLYTSVNDGVPNIILEMIARGLPIIASDAGGVGEVIMNGKTGVLIGDNSVASFVKAIKKLYANYSEYAAMAEHAQELLRTQHSTDNFIKKVKDMLK